MDDYSYIFVAAGIVAAIFTAIVLLSLGIKKLLYGKESPVQTVDAVVISKHTGTQVVTSEYVRPIVYPPRYTSVIPAYYITFTEPNGKHIELMVGEHDYAVIHERNYGKLTYQGKLFKRFQVNV